MYTCIHIHACIHTYWTLINSWAYGVTHSRSYNPTCILLYQTQHSHSYEAQTQTPIQTHNATLTHLDSWRVLPCIQSSGSSESKLKKRLTPDHSGGKNDLKNWTPTVFQALIVPVTQIETHDLPEDTACLGLLFDTHALICRAILVRI
jgi:hypothetical protein